MTAVATGPTTSAAEYLGRVEALLPSIRQAAPAIEAARQLPPEIASMLEDAGMFRVAVPRALGGYEFPPMVISQGIEMLAAADGSTGWCAMIGCDTGYLSTFLDDGPARDLLTGGHASAFVLNPSTAMAQPTEGGYNVTGRWTFASGCTHARTYALGCIVMTPQGPRMTNETTPEIRVVVVPAAKAEVIDTWTTTGVRGSGSHDVALSNVFVPEEHTFNFFPATTKRDGPLYRSPTAFAWKMAPVALGIARAAIDDVIAIAKTKISLSSRSPIVGQTWLHMAVAEAEARWHGARTSYYSALEDVWTALEAGGLPGNHMKARLHLAQTSAMESAVAIVDSMYRCSGSAALYAKGTMDRRLRDMHTITQHVILTPDSIATAGMIMLGLEPEPSPLFQ